MNRGGKSTQKPAYNPRTSLLKNLIACNGGDNWHWTGTRRFYLRELAQLQGFPHDFEFLGNDTEVKTQIGNAVPPYPFSAFMKNIIKTLEDVDEGRVPRHEPQRRIPSSEFASPPPNPPSQPSVIVLDDRNDDEVEVMPVPVVDLTDEGAGGVMIIDQ